MTNKLMTLLLGIFNFNQKNYIIDERGGYFVTDITGKYILGYNYITGYYAGCYIRFSQLVGIELSYKLESSIDEHLPDLTGNWRFDPGLIQEDKEEKYVKCDLLIHE